MRILVADKLAPFVPGRLEELGAELLVDPKLDGDTLAAKLRERDPEILVVRSTKVGKAHFEAGASLSLVIRAGAGVNTIDTVTASARGVYVANCPGKNAAAVAELTMGHLINLDRRIYDNVASLRAHKWDKKALGEARGLRGRTLAVLGCGAIGKEVVLRAKAFGMKIRGWSLWLPGELESLQIEKAETMEECVRGADAVSVHLALVPATEKRINASIFDAMKPGALFVNASRGEVVDQDALLAACAGKGIRAGLDVFAKEPPLAQGPFEDPIIDHPNVYGTCHIGASTDEAEEAVGEEVVRIVRCYQNAEPIPNCVNLAVKSGATHVIVVRHADRVGVLARVLHVLSEARLNVEGMENVIFAGGQSACARIEVVGEPAKDVVIGLTGIPEVFHVGVSAI